VRKAESYLDFRLEMDWMAKFMELQLRQDRKAVASARPYWRMGRISFSLVSLGHTEIWLLAKPDPHIRGTGFYRTLSWKITGVMKGQHQVLQLRNESR